MNEVAHKRGDTFEVQVVYSDVANTPLDITAYTIKSQVRNSRGKLYSDLTVNKTNPTGGQFTLTASDTSGWPVEQLFWDIQYSYGSTVVSTETIAINVTRDVTGA